MDDWTKLPNRIVKHYGKGTMERVLAHRHMVRPVGVEGVVAVNNCGWIGGVVELSIRGGPMLPYFIADCSQYLDAERHRAEGLIAEVDWGTAVKYRNFAWDGVTYKGDGHASATMGKYWPKGTWKGGTAMAFTPVKVIDKTMQTDPRVHGPKMRAGDPQGIVCHHTGSTNEAGDEYWLSHYHDNPVSINQLIKRNGTIIQIVPNDVYAWHAGVSQWAGRANCGSWMIGLEVCNSGTGREKYTDAQYESVAQTVAYNCARFHIPDKNVTSHARIALPAGRKNDPKAWLWQKMWARVDELRAHWPYPIPFWVDDSGTRVMST